MAILTLKSHFLLCDLIGNIFVFISSFISVHGMLMSKIFNVHILSTTCYYYYKQEYQHKTIIICMNDK